MANPFSYPYDAVVVGSGPNGLAAAITLQQNGLSVLVIEGKDTIGGGCRTGELTLPGFQHDICSAVHPLAAGSPALTSMPLEKFGLEFIYPEINAAHPLDDGSAAVLKNSLQETARLLGKDEQIYLDLITPIVENWPGISSDILGPFHLPDHVLATTAFGLKALQSATQLAKRFKTSQARALFAGMAAHAIQPLSNAATSSFGLVLMALGHTQGWPLPKGGSQAIVNAMAGYFESLGGKIETGRYIRSMDELPKTRTVLFDITPKQLLEIAGLKFTRVYTKQLSNYRYGMGVFKVDWALDEPVPFTAEACRKAGTVHIGGTIEEIAKGEQMADKGSIPDKPFVLLAQPSVFDNTRAPEGKHTAWAYCHVPHGSTADMTAIIESQVERFAPGFKKLIIGRHTMNTHQLQEYNPNYIGGDINGGVIDLGQLFTRPVLSWSPYRTSYKSIYICSSSTPPGGGVHGICGYYAARQVLRDHFEININRL